MKWKHFPGSCRVRFETEESRLEISYKLAAQEQQLKLPGCQKRIYKKSMIIVHIHIYRSGGERYSELVKEVLDQILGWDSLEKQERDNDPQNLWTTSLVTLVQVPVGFCRFGRMIKVNPDSKEVESKQMKGERIQSIEQSYVRQ